MHGTGSGRALPFPLAMVSDERDDPRLPSLPTARELRRARLATRFARRRMRYLMLNIGLGLAGWGVIAMAVVGLRDFGG